MGIDKKAYVDEDGRIVMGSTYLRAFTRENHCPANLYAIFFDGKEREPSAAMEKGNFFETLVLGESADGSKTLDIPKLQSGKPSKDEERIRENAIIAKNVFRAHKFEIQNIHPSYKHNINEYVSLATQPDTEAIKREEGLWDDDLFLIDLKATGGGLSNTYGEFAWGDVENMDHLQAKVSVYLAHKEHDIPIEKIHWIYAIFDYSSKQDYDLIKKVIRWEDVYELERTVNGIVELIIKYNKEKWPTNPSYDICSSCPIRNTCDKKVHIKPIRQI